MGAPAGRLGGTSFRSGGRMTSRLELHHGPRPALQQGHPAFQPGAQGQRARAPQFFHRQKNNEHDFAAVLTALSAADHCARTSRP